MELSGRQITIELLEANPDARTPFRYSIRSLLPGAFD